MVAGCDNKVISTLRFISSSSTSILAWGQILHKLDKAGLFFVRFKGNSILTKDAETRILLQNSILFLTKLIFPAFLSKFVELKLVFVWLEAISNQSFG